MCSQFFSYLQLMIFVDDAGGVLPAINHSPWDGLTLADLVMPFFLIIVGVSLSLTYKVSSIATEYYINPNFHLVFIIHYCGRTEKSS